MKKTLSMLLALCVVVNLGLIFTACGTSQETGSTQESSHTSTDAPSESGSTAGSADESTTETGSVAESSTETNSGSASESESESSSESESATEPTPDQDPAAAIGVKKFMNGYYLPMRREYFEKYGNVYQLDENRNFSFYYDEAKVTITASFDEQYLMTALNVPNTLSYKVSDLKTENGRPVSVTLESKLRGYENPQIRLVYSYDEAGELTRVTGGDYTLVFDYLDGSLRSASVNGKPDETIFGMASILDYGQFEVTSDESGNYVFSALGTDFILIPVTPEVICAAVSTFRLLLSSSAGSIIKAKQAKALVEAQTAMDEYVIYLINNEGSYPGADEVWYAYSEEDGYWVVLNGSQYTLLDEAPNLTGYTDVTSALGERWAGLIRLYVPAP